MRARGLVRASVGALVVTCACATAASGATSQGPVAGAARAGAASSKAQLQLVFPLKANLAALRERALAVSTPGSGQYGHYQSIAQLASEYGASGSIEHRTVHYLRGVGATHLHVDATGLFVDATLRADTAERLFATTISDYRSRDGVFMAPDSQPALPRGLRGLVTGVVGLNTQPVAHDPSDFASEHQLRQQIAAASQSPASAALTPLAHIAAQQASGYMPATGTQSGCAAGEQTGSFTPNQYLTAYNYAPLQAQGLNGTGERMAVIEIDGFKASDINTFASCFGLNVPPINAFGVGIKKALPPGGETTLDLEVLTAAAPGLKEIDVYESSSDESAALKALTSPLQNKGLKPNVISASLGLCEPFVSQAVGQNALDNTEGALEMAAASGISFLDSSGDSGSADCSNSDGSPIDKLAVNYPTSSWWVTGVGGTNLALTPQNTIANQVVWNDADLQPGSAGGGGQSLLWRRPPYQTGTVSPNVREVPDVAMLADVAPGYAIYCSAPNACVSPSDPNPWQGVGGTSAATPLLAGGFAMIDQALQASHKQDLGLANPLIYQLGQNAGAAPTVFSDVTSVGNDVGPFINPSGTPLGCCSAGPGYDDASGFGSVNLEGLAGAALASQPPIVQVSLSVPSGQRPIAAKQIATDVTCSGTCLASAYATIHVGHLKPIKIGGQYVRVTAATGGQVPVPIPLSKAVVKYLKRALNARYRVTAVVVGGVFSQKGASTALEPTPAQTIRITG